MKNYYFISALFLAFVSVSCNKDDDSAGSAAANAVEFKDRSITARGSLGLKSQQ